MKILIPVMMASKCERSNEICCLQIQLRLKIAVPRKLTHLVVDECDECDLTWRAKDSIKYKK
jgi:hypothetical protein